MKEPKAILFDFDGTLAYTLPAIITAFQTVFNTYGKPNLTHDEISALFGPTEPVVISDNIYDKKQSELALELYFKTYFENHPRSFDYLDEIVAFLNFLKSKEVKLGIVTAKVRKSLMISLDIFNMSSFFDAIITGDEVKLCKPDPEGIFKGLDALGTTPVETIFVGDTDFDIGAGQAAGLYTIGVQWFQQEPRTDFTVKPELVLKEISEFRKFLESIYSAE